MTERYVDDPFEDDSWQEPTTSIEHEILLACGRTRMRYQTQKESDMGQRIAERICLDPSSKKYLPLEYVREKIQWAREKNAYQIRIVTKALLSVILNEDNLHKWNERKGIYKNTEARDDYQGDL